VGSRLGLRGGRRPWARLTALVALALLLLPVFVLASAADPLGQVTEISSGISPNAHPDHIVAGPDGNLWFTESGESGTPAVARSTPGGVVTEFPVTGSSPEVIVVGPDHKIWFTESDANTLGRIDPLAPNPGATLTEFPCTCALSNTPEGLAVGPDQKLWFTENGGDNAGAIGRIDPFNTASQAEFNTGMSGGNPHPVEITAGSDGNMWFSEANGNRIGRILVAVPNTITEVSGVNNPEGITSGPDGNVWFVEGGTNSTIGRLDPRAANPASTLTFFTQGIASSAGADGIAVGCDNNLWFTEEDANQIGRITTAGVVTEFSQGITAASQPSGIGASVPGDPNMWFGEFGTDRVARIGVGACAGAAPPVVAPTVIVVPRFTG
jgi:streptogramin lyase